MVEYKKAFKDKCAERIWEMINNQEVKHQGFLKYVRSIELLWHSYLVKLKECKHLLAYQDLYNTYIDRLEHLVAQASNY